MKQLALLALCLGTLGGCMTTPESSGEHQDPTDTALAGTEKVAESEDALQGDPLADAGAGGKCVGQLTVKFKPALTFIPKILNSTISGTFNGCTFPTHPSVNSGELEEASGNGVFSCTFSRGSIDQTIRWNDGTSSTFSATSLQFSSPNSGYLLFTGWITDGLFKGHRIITEFHLLAADAYTCLKAAGLPEESGAATLTIDPL